jgi:hypothetical protein
MAWLKHESHNFLVAEPERQKQLTPKSATGHDPEPVLFTSHLQSMFVDRAGVDDRGTITSSGSKRFFLFAIVSRPVLGPNQPPFQWVLGSSTGIKRPKSEADHSPPSSAVVKMRGAVILLPNTSSWGGA